MPLHELLNSGQSRQLGNGKVSFVDFEGFPTRKRATSNQGAACGKANGLAETHALSFNRVLVINLNCNLMQQVVVRTAQLALRAEKKL
jgi:hypothetical protein